MRYPNRSVRPPPLSGVSDSHTSRDLPLGNLDVLACEEARFHGTAAGSEHRECAAPSAPNWTNVHASAGCERDSFTRTQAVVTVECKGEVSVERRVIGDELGL